MDRNRSTNVSRARTNPLIAILLTLTSAVLLKGSGSIDHGGNGSADDGASDSTDERFGTNYWLAIRQLEQGDAALVERSANAAEEIGSSGSPETANGHCGAPGSPGRGERPRHAAFAATVARRYSAGGEFWAARSGLPRLPVHGYEIWNEPNLTDWWCVSWPGRSRLNPGSGRRDTSALTATASSQRTWWTES